MAFYILGNFLIHKKYSSLRKFGISYRDSYVTVNSRRGYLYSFFNIEVLHFKVKSPKLTFILNNPLFNTKWQKKKYYMMKQYLHIKKISNDKRKQLYDIMNMPIVENSNFYNDTEEMLKKQLNMQECVKKLKLERR